MDLILKLSGSFLILVGVIALALSETKSILLGKVKQGKQIKIQELSKIKGIENVSFITGKYDILINVRLRSIGKAFSLIENSISQLPWIEEIKTLNVMKEYE